MNRDDLTKLVDDVFSLVNQDLLTEYIGRSRSSERVDGVQDLLRTAIINSSIGKYKGFPYFFNGRIYERMSFDDFSNLIYELLLKCKLPFGDYARFKGITDICMKAVSGKELSPDKSIMVFANCVLDTKTRQTYRFNERFIQVTAVDYKYEKDAFCPMWLKFLEDVLPDKRDRRILQEALGCLLINRSEAKLEHITFLYGTGSNGKSVVFNTVLGVFGRENISNFPLSSLLYGSEKKKNIATMDGLWANYSGESQEVNITRNEDAFKTLISGEPMEARDIYGPNFTAYNIPLQFANINKLPVIKRMNYALKRRIVIIDFKVEIPVYKQNRQLSNLFKNEYSGIFNWIMDGRDRFVKNGYDFTDRDYIEEKTDEYQAEGNSVMKFMHTMKYRRQPKSDEDMPRLVLSNMLYSAYDKWCKSNDILPENINTFGGILREAGYERRRFANGNKYVVYGDTVIDTVQSTPAVSRQKTSNEDNCVPYVMGGREYINTMKGISEILGVSHGLMSLYRRSGLLKDCFHIGGENGRQMVFDIAKTRSRVKQLGELMSDEDREMIRKAQERQARQRAMFNQDMKRTYSRKRIYKTPEDDRLVEIMNEIKRKERKLTEKEIKKAEKHLNELDSKLNENK